MSHTAAGSTDDQAAQAVRRHHAQLADGLDERAESLLRLVDDRHLPEAEHARRDLVAYLRRELVPHALAEEHTLYAAAAARPAGGPLVEGMLDEHRAITALVGEVADAGSLVRAAAAARALAVLFATHLTKENDLILPMLVAAGDVSLADLLGGMHELLGAGDSASGPGRADDHPADDIAGESAGPGGCGCGDCGCGGAQTAGAAAAPTLGIDARLDVRDVPHNRRHALVLSTVEALAPGEAVVLVAPHAPRPVLAEVEARFPEQVRTRWLESGPQVWQVRLERTSRP